MCHPPNFGVMGFAVISSPSMRRAAEIAMQYADLTVTFAEHTLTDHGEEFRFIRDDHAIPADIHRFVLERDPAAVATVQQDVLGSRLPIIRAEDRPGGRPGRPQCQPESPSATRKSGRAHAAPEAGREGTTFREVSNETVGLLAEEMLIAGLTVEHAAERLGYSSVSAFATAFRGCRASRRAPSPARTTAGYRPAHSRRAVSLPTHLQRIAR
ncbi:AraC family transcriptional regulator ligand-binding domain-containing protein [Nocardia sp. GAS34]